MGRLPVQGSDPPAWDVSESADEEGRESQQEKVTRER